MEIFIFLSPLHSKLIYFTCLKLRSSHYWITQSGFSSFQSCYWVPHKMWLKSFPFRNLSCEINFHSAKLVIFRGIFLDSVIFLCLTASLGNFLLMLARIQYQYFPKSCRMLWERDLWYHEALWIDQVSFSLQFESLFFHWRTQWFCWHFQCKLYSTSGRNSRRSRCFC